LVAGYLYLSVISAFMLSATVKTYRNAYSGLSRETWLLSLIMLINRSGTMVIPFMTLYLTSAEMGYSVKQAGFVFGLFGAGAFCGAWFGGKLTDKTGFYRVQILTLAGGGILFFVLGQMKTFPLICTFTFLLSFVNEAFRPANSTAIAFYCKEENRTRSYALNRLAINLGWALGSGLGGLIAHIDYELLFWVDGCTNISAAILIAIFLKPVQKKATPGSAPEDPLIRSVFKDRTYLVFALITTLFACCFFQIFTNLPVFFKKEMQFSEPFIGLLMAVNGLLIALIEMVLVYRLEPRKRSLFFIALGVFTVGLGFIFLNVPGGGAALAFAVIIMITLGEILSMPFMNSYWISRTQHNNRGQYAALYTMSWSAAQTLGPMLGAQLAEGAGFQVLWWVVGSVSIFTALLFRRLEKNDH
jgi:predicted MFS family arabinose efflux permease